MKKLLRKNQIIITALVVLVAVAGYLSITNRDELTMNVNNESVEDKEVADISEEDIVLDEDESASASTASVSAVEKKKKSKKTEEQSTASKETQAQSTASKKNAGEAVLVSNTVGKSYFEEAKLSREQTRAKNKETLTELVNNKNVSSAQKDKAMNEIMKMTTVSEKETATENLLAAKGFDEAVVTIVEDGVDVVVNAKDLTEPQIAQIEDVVKRKTECSVDKIVISAVGKKQ